MSALVHSSYFVASRAFWAALLVLCLAASPARAQTASRLTGGTPPPPEAAALGKFAETPVSLYTGVPSISIPIYEVKLRGITLPISLNYHAGGVRVSEIASSVGLGWALQAGGSISSTTMGKDDFGGAGYANAPRTIPTDHRLTPVLDSPDDYDFCKSATGTVGGQSPPGTVGTTFDTQPDLFYYSMCGRSGKFFHNQAGQAHTVPFEPLTIRRDKGYTITDENGNRFYFQQVEVAKTSIIRLGGPSSPQDDYEPQATVFYLSRVETPTHESITLSYDTLTYGYGNLGSYTRYKTFSTTQNSENQGCVDKPPTSTTSTTRVAGLQLASVRSSRGDFVEFVYSSCKRLDLAKGEALKEIRVHKGSTVQRFTLGFGYFNAPAATSDCDWVPGTSLPDEFRLKLISVTESGKPSYVIKYNESGPMPNRLSEAQDHWGFYNGKSTLLPAEPEKGFYQGGDRNPDAQLMQVGIIKSLRFPTGGYTEYYFEPNSYSIPAGIVNIDSVVVPVNIFAGRPNDSIPGAGGIFVQDMKFRIPAGVNINSCQATFVAGCGTQVPQTRPQFLPTLSGPGNYERTFGYVDDGKPSTEALNLLPGEYTLKATTYGYCPEDFLRIEYSYSVQRQMPATNRLSGGLRVREIRSYANAYQKEPIRQRYRYAHLQDSTLSSGQVLAVPTYSYESLEHHRYKEHPQFIQNTCRYYTQSSSSILPLSNVQGGSTGYTSVQVFKDKSGEHGMSHHTFSWAKDYALYSGYPFTPTTSLDWQRGLPLQVTEYAWTGQNGYHPVRRVRSHYMHNYTPPSNFSCEDCATYTPAAAPNETHAIGLNILVQRPETYTKPVSGSWTFEVISPAQFLIESFKYVSVWSYVAQKDEYLYHPTDTTQFRLTKTFFKYDNPKHAQLSRIQTLTSAGDTLTTKHLYALDYDTAQAATAVALGIRSLARQHKLDELVEQQQWLRNKTAAYITGGKLAQYRSGLPSQDLTLQVSAPIPASAFTSSAISAGHFLQDARYRPVLAYERYDGLGNILQARQTQAGAQSFLWGYSATQPIAKIINADYTQVAYTSFEPASAGRWLYSPAGVVAGGHTGRWCYQLSSTISRDSLPSGEYQLSLWATAKPRIYQNGTLISDAGKVAGPADSHGFQCFIYSLHLMAAQNVVSLPAGQSLRLDELRLHPVGAQLTTYTHDPLTGITSQTDATGRTTSYEYDDLGRLQRTRDERSNILTQQEYHYGRP